MLRYLIFIIFGILLFLLLNHRETFNVGIPWCIRSLSNPDAPPPSPIYESEGEADAELLQAENEDLHVVECDPQGECIGIPPDLVIPEALPPGRLDVVTHANISKLFKAICDKVNETFSTLDDDKKNILKKRIVEAILVFIGESEDPIRIIQGMRQTTLIYQLPDECAALIIQCMDISDTNEIPLDILFQLLEQVGLHHTSAGRSYGFQVIIHTMILFSQAINNYPEVIQINDFFWNFIDLNWFYLTPEDYKRWLPIINPKSMHKFLWIYVNRQLIPWSWRTESRRGVHSDASPVSELLLWQRLNIDNEDDLDRLYREMGGPPLCDDSDD